MDITGTFFSSCLLYDFLTTSRSVAVSDINLKRAKFGEFHHLYNDLRKDPGKFRNYMRMDIDTFDYILCQIQGSLFKRPSNFIKTPLSPAEKLVITLRCFGTGLSFNALAFSFRVGRSTVANIIYETCVAIWSTMQESHLGTPTKGDFYRIAHDFERVWQFPHCIGALDGKHIRIKCPPNSGSNFYNYKGYFSIVLQAVSDAFYKFICIDVGGYGHQHDANTLKSSIFYKLLTQHELHIPPMEPLTNGNATALPYVFLADEAYPLMENIMRPYPKRSLNEETQYFNDRLSRGRKTIECAFGILSNKWRILWKPIEADPKHVDLIVKALCVLHNVVIDKEGFEQNLKEYEQAARNTRIAVRSNRFNRAADIPIRIRESFKEYFVNNLVV